MNATISHWMTWFRMRQWWSTSGAVGIMQMRVRWSPGTPQLPEDEMAIPLVNRINGAS